MTAVSTLELNRKPFALLMLVNQANNWKQPACLMIILAIYCP